ncbi:UNVERIFIED_CONTAM: hypothetical protein Sradi_2095200 [Sesamum radiatum]|uniref:Retrotransposon gag domain-containing protein n=1 Tax=Sesamum radiatum TaxID=300843 RepID=A0AAW2TIV5_SESRA
MAKQFVRSFKGKAFDWYIDLEPESIEKFLSCFYSTRGTMSMVELTNTRQWKDEPVIDYINRWCAQSLNCKDKLSEASAIEMCIQYKEDTTSMNTYFGKRAESPTILPTVPPKLQLNSSEPAQMEAAITNMEPYTKVESYVGDVKLYLNPGGMQEAMHSKFLTS